MFCVVDSVHSATIALSKRGTLTGNDSSTWGHASNHGAGAICGHSYDLESGFDYNLFRYYDESIKAYLSPDPLGLAGGPNEFAYLRSPVAQFDPLGMQANCANAFALGLDAQGLDDFADDHDADTYKDFPDQPWRDVVRTKILDPDTQVHFNMDGVDIWPGLSRAAAGRGGPTDWELLTVQQNPQIWNTVTFWKGGSPVPNPFE